MKTILLFIFLLSTFSSLSAQESNPLLQWVGKPYGVYHDTYKAICDSLFEGPQRDHAKLLRWLEEAAKADRSGEWELIRQQVVLHAKLYRQREGGYVVTGGQTAEDFGAQFAALAEAAGKKDFPLVRLRLLFDAANCYRIFAQNYERAFSLYKELASELAKLSTHDFPLRPYIYWEMANLYAQFREYDEANVYYRLIMKDPEARNSLYRPYFPALYGMGQCYRNGSKDYVCSDSCFRQLLDSIACDDAYARWLWTGIAEGCLGVNQYLQGHYDEALPLLLAAARDITRANDYPFLSEVHVYLADIYLRRKDFAAAGEHLERALALHRETLLPEKSPLLYRVHSKYMTYRGRPDEAAALLDSALMASARDAEAFSGLVLRRVEQQLRETDNRVHREREGFLRLLVTVAGIVLAVVLVLLAVIASLYRNKHRAYHELVRRSQLWAGVTPADAASEREVPEDKAPDIPARPVGEAVPFPPADAAAEGMSPETAAGAVPAGIPCNAGNNAGNNAENNTENNTGNIAGDIAGTIAGTNTGDITGTIAGDNTGDITGTITGAEAANAGDKADPLPATTDHLVMQSIGEAIAVNRLYKRSDLSLDVLAAATGYNRYYISSALNHCTGKNFNTYVNEFRVKEAVRLLSDPANASLTVEAIGYDAGFNDRSNFYRIFKKMTGLSPTDFRKNSAGN